MAACCEAPHDDPRSLRSTRSPRHKYTRLDLRTLSTQIPGRFREYFFQSVPRGNTAESLRREFLPANDIRAGCRERPVSLLSPHPQGSFLPQVDAEGGS